MKKTLIFSSLLLGSLCMKGQTTDLTYKIDSMVKINITKDTPGYVVGVIKEGKLLYKQTYGLANLDYRIPVSDSTLFNLASVSKQFTAFLVLLLEKEGKLNLDDTMQKYIPELENYGHPITIRQLLHHTSGIPSTDNLRLFAGLSLEMPWNVENEMGMIQSYQKLNFVPNAEELYSNAGYFLLTRIIEKVTGESFSECIREKIFKPLEMKTAVIYDSPGKVILNRAQGYRKTGDYFTETNTKGESIYGSTNQYVSVNDMINWSKSLTTGSLGGKKLADRLFNPCDKLNNGDTIRYTFGFSTGRHRGLKTVEHGGFTMGFKTQTTLIPEAGFSVFVLSNNENSDPYGIALKIVDLYLANLLKPEIKKEHKEISINKELYQLYKGSFIIPEGIVFRFDIINDTLKLIIPGAPHFVLYPEKDNEFFLKDFDAQCTFIRDINGKVNEIIWHQSNQNTKGIRYSAPKPMTQKELQSFTGIYEIPELNVIYPVSMNGNELIITLPKSFRQINFETSLKVGSMSGDKFYGKLGMIDFKRNKKGKVTGFVFADVGRLRNIEFIKKD